MTQSLNVANQYLSPHAALYQGDSVTLTEELPTGSVGFSLFSPPFSSLYIYSDHLEDMGNCADDAEFFAQFGYLVQALHRVTVPGRLCAVHCKDLPLYAGRDGAAGLRDFPGAVIRCFEEAGWTYHSRVTIWKCPVIEMQRTKNHGLLYKQLRADSSASRQGMADYLVVFRKWQGGPPWPAPISHTREEFPLDQWQEWASPVWMDIQQPNVLNYQIARESQDEKHICPLQLDLIERAIRLWSNPGDVVFDPFLGIGSVAVVAVQLGRQALGMELKQAYFQHAARNVQQVEGEKTQLSLFSEEPAA